jgi:hypothetical protein
MDKSKVVQKNIDCYTDIFCGFSNELYGICVFLSFSKPVAKLAVSYAYDQAADNVKGLPSIEDHKSFLFKHSWDYIVKNSPKPEQIDAASDFSKLAKTDSVARASFIAMDVLELSFDDTFGILKVEKEDLSKKIINFRKII